MYEYMARVRRVIDGDTVDLDLDMGCEIHFWPCVRLYGIDAPEIHGVKKGSEEYKVGIAATEFLQKLIGGKDVCIRTYKDKKGKYGRYLAEIFIPDWLETSAGGKAWIIDAINVNQLMIEKGFAKPYFGGKRGG